MKALSLWQPWASLIAIGAKTIETRGWATSYRGPLAIHAAQSFAGLDALGIDGREGGWDHAEIGDYQFCICKVTSGVGQRGNAHLTRVGSSHAPEIDGPVPLGAVVATCELVDCVPIGRKKGRSSYVAECEDEGDLPHQQGGLWLIGPNGITRGTPTRIEDQRPYGDYTDGRVAWLLSEIQPCEPVPAKGRQGLWDWTPA